MTDEQASEYLACFAPEVPVGDSIGWHELVQAALGSLLQGKLGRRGSDHAFAPSLSCALTHCEGLKQTIALALERIETLHAS
jgi:hypothetical protein